jgi:hypothetical protein
MSLKIEDQLVDMMFADVFEELKTNAVGFGTAFLKGPVVSSTETMEWVGTDYKVKKGFGLACSSPNPLDMFPCGDSKEVDDGDIIERMLSTGKELSQKRGVPYWQAEEINKLLQEHPNGYRTPTLTHDSARAIAEEKAPPSLNYGKRYELLEMWDDFAGAMLDEWGIKGLDPAEFYSCQVIVCGNRVLKVMPNPDPLGRRPYFKAVFKRVSGSFWGNGVPHIIADAQDLANACIRAISNNMAFSSGPMVAVDVTRLANGAKEIESLHPWQLFQFENPAGVTSKAIEFFVVPNCVRELMDVYKTALNRMDDESGLPAFQYGSEEAAGAGRTLGGLTLLQEASGRVITDTIHGIDRKVISPFISRMYEWNMLFSDDQNIKGDAKVATRGTSALVVKQMKLERLSAVMQETANPFDMQVLGLPGRAELLRQRIKMLDLGDAVEKIVPTGKDLAARLAEAQAQAAMPEQGGRNTLGTPAKTQ